jgi:hypothetical protein
MAKSVATPKQTGGGGFTFEDAVIARFLLFMLAGRHPLDAEDGPIESVGFQKRVSGWLLDDVVLELQSTRGTTYFALSVKSNEQVTAQGFPKEFVRTVWEHWLRIGTDKFDQTNDHLGLVSSFLDNGVRAAWHGVLGKARKADSDDFGTRLETVGYANDLERSIFKSLGCPSDLSTGHEIVGPATTAQLLARLRLFAFDFAESPSHERDICLALCQTILRASDTETAMSLWTHMLRAARDYSSVGGDLTRPDLVRQLRGQFSLLEYPNYQPDWQRLVQTSRSLSDRVRDTIGGRLRLDRPDLLRDVGTSLEPGQFVVAIGPSGCGKSVITKRLATDMGDMDHVLWMNAAFLNEPSLDTIRQKLGLKYAIEEIIDKSNVAHGLIVFDGLDSYSGDALRNTAAIIRAAFGGGTSCPWRILGTCGLDRWEIVYRSMVRESVDPTLIVALPLQCDLTPDLPTINQAFPELSKILLRANIQKLFRNLKVLDLVASQTRMKNEQTVAWVGETDVLRWYWEEHVAGGADGLGRSRFLQRLSEIEAADLARRVPISRLSDEECRVLRGLLDDNVCAKDEEEVGFDHDLFADWARQRRICSEGDKLVPFIRQQCLNPRWHRAIRLVGLQQLEDPHKGSDAWRSLIVQLSSPENSPTQESDLVLEAAFFAADPLPLLESAWGHLCEAEGLLLSRLLNRFLHVATFPNPLLASAEDENGGSYSTASAAMWRLPYWPLWLPMIQFIHGHREEAIDLCPDPVTQIADLWLRQSGNEWSHRREAAEILIDAARWLSEAERGGERYYSDKLDERVYRRLLAAAMERPDNTVDIVLKLAERVATNSKPAEDDSVSDSRALAATSSTEKHSTSTDDWFGPVGDPWPDGPLRRVDDAFREACFGSAFAMLPLINACPEIASEVILALLIREPLPEDRFGYRSSLGLDELEIESTADWFPAIYFHGPFLPFLQRQPAIAIKMIVRLINFATERWAETLGQGSTLEQSDIVIRVIGQEYRWVGNLDVYFWYRERLIHPYAVPTALMALEKWLYDVAEKDESLDNWILQILGSSRSVALAGVLIALGKKFPKLFQGSLRSLLGVWQFHQWEQSYAIDGFERATLGMTLMSWTRYGEKVWNIAKEWHTLPHRSTALGDLAVRLFVDNIDMRNALEDARIEWQQELSKRKNDGKEWGYLEQIIAVYDIENWKVQEVEDGLKIEWNAPPELQERRQPEVQRNQRLQTLLGFPIQCRRRLEENNPLPNKEIEPFWTLINQVAEYEPVESSPGDTIFPAHAIVAGIAVLVVHHSSWLEAVPERLHWCEVQMHRVIQSPPPGPQFDVAESIYDCDWQSFLADAVPFLFAKDTENTWLRQLVAELAMTFHYVTSGKLMKRCFQVRARLGDDFFRLQNLITIWAAVREVHRVTHGGNSIWDTPNVPFNVGIRYEHLLRAFVTRRLPSQPISWQRLARQADERIVRMLRKERIRNGETSQPADAHDRLSRRIRRLPGLDPHLLRQAFAWIPRLDEAKNTGEKSSWIAILEEELGIVLRTLGTTEDAFADKKSHFASHTPNDWDRRVFQQIAEAVPQMTPDDLPERLWKPILMLGLERHYWVRDFVSSFFLHGFKLQDYRDAFFREWNRMIDFVHESNVWPKDSEMAWRCREEMFLSLFGLDWYCECLRVAEIRPYITDMRERYREWATVWLERHDSARRFAKFLTWPSAVDIAEDGLVWLNRAAEDMFRRQRHDDELEHAITDCLEHFWQKRREDIKNAPETRAAFMGLLKRLADLMFPRALELQDVIAR